MLIRVQVIGAGHGRTGTKSLHQALKILGIAPVYDFPNATRNIPVNKLLVDQLRLKKPYGFLAKFPEGVWQTADEWDMVFGDFAACVDSPCNFLVSELAHVYPTSKVVLTVRDSPEKWFKSYNGSVMDRERRFRNSWSWRVMTRLRNWTGLEKRGHNSWLMRMFREGNSPVLRTTVQTYIDHNSHVREHVPSDRLLEFNVKEGEYKTFPYGFLPLCKFLDKPVPSVPFPYVNDGAWFKDMTEQFVREAEEELRVVLVVLAISMIVGIEGVRYYIARPRRSVKAKAS
ncbi:hypothetical protein AC579_399 [Pseudocercospora musae]|uniref:P-loop containing nucleoside triphosphate hydrolase protein n=1 Tax=Pseudocercospora musae TaxID=113226 RepID=A0A139HFW5_9PEZI|nr:hypothetical protein AC579_399 [Pseudocercospora musae]